MRVIRARIGDCTSDRDKEQLQERLTKLACGVVAINVGASREEEFGDVCKYAAGCVGSCRSESPVSGGCADD